MTMEKLGRYDIVRVLGKGAMGLVYEARDPNLDRRVAIKTIKVENLPEAAVAEYEARFRTEARSAARLQHPNIVSVYDSERHGDTAYLVMEFVQGQDLKQHLDRGRQYSLEQSLAIVQDLLAALEYAHKQNIVHRDVKPANLLMVESSGRAKLTDFGVARIQDSGELTRTKGSMVGTLKYMAPEQVRGKPIDFRADLFATGVVLYQLLTGKRPFDGDSEFAIMHQIMEENPPPPSTINAALPKALDHIVARALAKNREQRYASAAEFSASLRDAVAQIEDTTIVMPPDGTGQRAPEGSGSRSGMVRTGTGGSTVRTAASGEESGSTVTQELELVYWKDVKDTQDTADLEGFLERFPGGIYADLARRRLKKLNSIQAGEISGTQPTGVTTKDDSTSTVLAPAAPAPGSSIASPEGTVAAAHVQAQPEAVVNASVPVAPAAAKSGKGWLIAVAGVAAVAAAGLAFKLTGQPAEPAPAAAASAASTPAPATAAVVGKPALPAVPAPAPAADKTSKAVAAKPAAQASAAKPVAAKPAAPAVQAAPAVPAATALPPTPAVTARSPAPVTPPRTASDNPAPTNGSAGPAQACEGRILLGYQICMNEQCTKPSFANHPVCVQRRDAEKQRNNQGVSR